MSVNQSIKLLEYLHVDVRALSFNYLNLYKIHLTELGGEGLIL